MYHRSVAFVAKLALSVMYPFYKETGGSNIGYRNQTNDLSTIICHVGDDGTLHQVTSIIIIWTLSLTFSKYVQFPDYLFCDQFIKVSIKVTLICAPTIRKRGYVGGKVAA